jgi:hypothetical protein
MKNKFELELFYFVCFGKNILPVVAVVPVVGMHPGICTKLHVVEEAQVSMVHSLLSLQAHTLHLGPYRDGIRFPENV